MPWTPVAKDKVLALCEYEGPISSIRKQVFNLMPPSSMDLLYLGNKNRISQLNLADF